MEIRAPTTSSSRHNPSPFVMTTLNKNEDEVGVVVT
jgi:hypothetical protein